MKNTMKMTTYKPELLRLSMQRLSMAVAMLTLALCCLKPVAACSQDDYFTLSNGRLWWYEGASWGTGHKSEVAFDKNSVPKAWAKVWRYNPSNVTHITNMGDVLLRLDLTDEAHPAIQSVPA